jgi:hypothetical protein
MKKPRRYSGELVEAKIAGIPCLVELTGYSPYRCNRIGHPDNWLPDDPEEIEFEVFDRRGNPAPWLERKMTPDDISNIEELLLKGLKNDPY